MLFLNGIIISFTRIISRTIYRSNPDRNAQSHYIIA